MARAVSGLDFRAAFSSAFTLASLSGRVSAVWIAAIASSIGTGLGLCDGSSSELSEFGTGEDAFVSVTFFAVACESALSAGPDFPGNDGAETLPLRRNKTRSKPMPAANASATAAIANDRPFPILRMPGIRDAARSDYFDRTFGQCV